MEGLKVSDANIVVYIHPSMSTKVSQAVLRELSSQLFKFSETFDGVVLAYDVNTCTKLAKILPGVHPYFGVRLEAKLLLFHPKPDMLLEGKVVKVTPHSIHVIVLGFSSAVIAEEDIREEFKYKIRHGEEVFASKSHKRHRIKVGTVLRFIVKSFDEEILHMSGSLLPAHTGSVLWLSKNTSQIDSPEKRKEIEGKLEEQEHDGLIADTERLVVNSNHKHKRSKRHRSESS